MTNGNDILIHIQKCERCQKIEALYPGERGRQYIEDCYTNTVLANE